MMGLNRMMATEAPSKKAFSSVVLSHRNGFYRPIHLPFLLKINSTHFQDYRHKIGLKSMAFLPHLHLSKVYFFFKLRLMKPSDAVAVPTSSEL